VRACADSIILEIFLGQIDIGFDVRSMTLRYWVSDGKYDNTDTLNIAVEILTPVGLFQRCLLFGGYAAPNQNRFEYPTRNTGDRPTPEFVQLGNPSNKPWQITLLRSMQA